MANYIGTLKDEKGNEFYPHCAQEKQNSPKIFTTEITVTGDADTYYPVMISFRNRNRNDYAYKKVSISRLYSETAPSTWNTSTHKGGLTFSFYWTGDIAWGGNDQRLKVLEFQQSYSKMVYGWKLAVSGGVFVWLRGGTAKYLLTSETYALNTTVYYDTPYTASDGTVFEPKTGTPASIPNAGDQYATISMIHPIGSIYISTSETNPSSIMPGTTWEQIQDKFLLAAGSTYTAGNTGGSATHTHTTGNFTLGTNHIPSHNHYLSRSTNSNGSYSGWRAICSSDSSNADYSGTTTWTSSVGGGQAHNHGATGSTNHLPPYLVVYMWKRTA